MKPTARVSIALAAILVLSSWAIPEPRAKEDAPTNVSFSEISAGYALLYDLVSKEKQSSLLSIIKKESPELKSLLERISETSKATAKELDTLARIHPPLNLKVASAENRTSGTRLHRQGDEQTDFTEPRRGPGVQHGEAQLGGMNYAADLARSSGRG